MMVCCSKKSYEMMQLGRSKDELRGICAFVCCQTDDQVAHVAEHGIVVNASNVSNLGTCILLTLFSLYLSHGSMMLHRIQSSSQFLLASSSWFH